ncbi:MAG: Ig-like domain-containing protein, partial [Methylocella sp.]
MTMPILGRVLWAAIMLALALLLPAVASAQNAYITNSGDNTISVINTATSTVVTTIPIGGINHPKAFGVAVTPNGSKAYVTNGEGDTVSVIDTATNAVISTIFFGDFTTGIAVAPDGTKAYVGVGGTLFAWGITVIDTVTDKPVTSIPLPTSAAPEGIAVTPDGSKVYVVNSGVNTVSVINTATETVTTTIPVGGEGVAVTPNGTKVYVANTGDNTVTVIATANDQVVTTIPVGINPFGVAVTRDGTKVYITNDHDNTVSVIATANDQVVTTIPVGAQPMGVAVTPDGTMAYVANGGGGTVSVINTATSVTTTIPVGNGPAAFGNFIGGPAHASPPVAVNETKTTPANTPVTIDLSVGATGNPTSAALVGTPVGGTVADFPATTVTFTPTTGFSGTASFQFTLANAFGTSNTATATITVAPPPPPVAVNETATTNAGVPVPIDLKIGATGNPTSAALVGTPVGGTVAGFPGTTLTFTPTMGFTGTASFQFALANAFGTSNTATTTITVKGPDPNFKLSASAYCNTSPPVAPAVQLSWTAQDGAASYDLYRNGQLYSQNIPQTSFDNNANIATGNTYAYFVVAHASGREIESNVVSVLVPSGTCSAAALPNLVIQ